LIEPLRAAMPVIQPAFSFLSNHSANLQSEGNEFSASLTKKSINFALGSFPQTDLPPQRRLPTFNNRVGTHTC
jgi:hypothetical protein